MKLVPMLAFAVMFIAVLGPSASAKPLARDCQVLQWQMSHQLPALAKQRGAAWAKSRYSKWHRAGEAALATRDPKICRRAMWDAQAGHQR